MSKKCCEWNNAVPLGETFNALQHITFYNKLQQILLNEQEISKQTIMKAVVEAQELERQSISRELHDNVNQLLTTAQLILQSAQSSSEKQDRCLQKSHDVIGVALKEIRHLSHQLMVPSFHEFTLTESIHDLIASLTLIGISTRVNLPIDERLSHLDESIRLSIYRILQAQINNISKHSKAKVVNIILQLKNKQLTLSIKDDGVGFDPQQKRKGIGLNNIATRASMHQGNVQINTNNGEGCELIVSIPL